MASRINRPAFVIAIVTGTVLAFLLTYAGHALGFSRLLTTAMTGGIVAGAIPVIYRLRGGPTAR